MVVTNTFNHTSDKPRFRAVFPTSEILTPEVYGLIQGCLADKLEDAGYTVDRGGKRRKGVRLSNSRPSGLDWSTRLPTSLFYLPCQAQEPGASFFQDYGGDKRQPLQPAIWLQNMTFALVPGIEVLGQPEIPRAGVDEVLVQRAKDIWRSSKGEPGKGDEMFFSLALSLRRAGMEFYEIESALHSEASYGRTPKERLSQIPSIMSSLRRYSRSAEFNEAEKEELERLSDLQELLHDAQCERVILQKAGEETALHETVIDKIREEMKATQGKTDDQNSL